jgi:hypothetical protein
MAEVIQKTTQEFWQPPSPLVAGDMLARDMMATELAVPVSLPAMAEVCPSCGTEFLLGSRFCHACGRKRPEAMSADDKAHAAEFAGLWEQGVARVQSVMTEFSSARTWNRVKFPSWLHYLSFHEIQKWIGLSTASLIAFIVGLACVAGALLVGLLTAKTFGEWQAIQIYRQEWLLGATVAFVAGILLKRSSDRD